MSTTDLETRINDWVASNAEWVEDSVEHTLSERNTKMDGTGTAYHAIDVRFLQEDTKANVLQKFEDKLVNKVDWYRVGYHACTHDESNPLPCAWDSSTDWTAKDVTIPSGVPNIN